MLSEALMHDMTFYYAAARPDHALTADHATIPYIGCPSVLSELEPLTA